MKFGKRLQSESVPRWRIHNVDYNSLKYEIKAHTTRNQATAISIPGSEDVNLIRFENRFYDELFAQHERVDDFVTSKTSEIYQRLSHLETCIHRLLSRYTSADELSVEVQAKHQRRLSKYEHDLLKCGDDIHSLDRFISAQIVAFRKILKKYQKWTGSATLTLRFRENVLQDPKSFTRRDNTHLRTQYDGLLLRLRETLPEDESAPGSPESLSVGSRAESSNTPATPPHPHQIFAPLPPATAGYWNEYDNGSEAGDANDEYAIYINPNDEFDIPGFDFIRSKLATPFAKARDILTLRTLRGTAGERTPLLGSATRSSSDTDDEYTSSDEQIPSLGYQTHYAAFPSVSEQRAARQRDQVLSWVTVGSFMVSFALIAITSALIATGKHKLRLEVEAGVTVGIITSLFSGCVGVGLLLVRADHLGVWQHIAGWASFLSVCVLNGMLLVLIMEW